VLRHSRQPCEGALGGVILSLTKETPPIRGIEEHQKAMRRPRRPTVYILECSAGRFYTGVTSNLGQRLGQHADSVGSGYAARHGPCRIVWFTECPTTFEALELEKRIKGWRREKKVALIEGRGEDLPGLSLARNPSQRRASSGSA
jgi:putative endonuclease